MAFFANVKAEPTFGSMFGQGFGQGLEKGISRTLEQFFKNQQMQKENSTLQKTFENIPEDAPFETKFKGIMTSNISPQSKELALGSLVNYERIKDQRSQQQAKELAEKGKAQKTEEGSKATYNAYKAAGRELPEYQPGTPASVWGELAKEKKESETEIKQQEKTQKSQGLLQNISRLRELIPYTGNWMGTKTFGGPLRRETIQKRAEIKGLSFGLESFYRDMAAKGNMPLGIFEKLMTILPDPELSERENLGRLDASERMIKQLLPETQMPQKKSMTINKVPVGTDLTNEAALEFKIQANGDRAKAEQLARQAGYKF